MDSGRVRTRRLALQAWTIYDFTWNFLDDAFDTFKTFFEETLNHGTEPFVIEIFGVDTEVRFLEPDYSHTHEDRFFVVTAQLCTL